MPTSLSFYLGAVLAIFLAVAGGFTAGDLHRGAADLVEYTAKIETQNAQAEKLLADKTAEVAALQKQRDDFNLKVEADDAAHQKALATKDSTLAALGSELDRVRRLSTGSGKGCSIAVRQTVDPSAGSVGANPSGGNSGPTPGSFSELAAIAANAVDAARRGGTCHEWAVGKDVTADKVEGGGQ